MPYLFKWAPIETVLIPLHKLGITKPKIGPAYYQPVTAKCDSTFLAVKQQKIKKGIFERSIPFSYYITLTKSDSLIVSRLKKNIYIYIYNINI